MFASDWKPPENPDPHEILHEAVEDTRGGRYERALARHVWFHRHALEYEESLTGVRLSFALSYWLELGKRYPPALAEFKEIRDETKERIVREEGAQATFKDFHDLRSMNRELGERAITVEAFLYLHKHNPTVAEDVYNIAEPALIEFKKYKICGEYLAPKKRWSSIIKKFRFNRKFAKEPEFGERQLEYANESFINGTTTLVALLVVNDRKDEAGKIAEKARRQPFGEKFQEQFNKKLNQALEETVPQPWP